MVTAAAAAEFLSYFGASVSASSVAASITAIALDMVINFGPPPPPSPMFGRISRGVLAARAGATRPPGGILEPASDQRFADGSSLRIWEGYDPESKTLTGGMGMGSCLTPEFADPCFMVFDRALAPRTGDVVLVEELVDGSCYRAAKLFEETEGNARILCNEGCYTLRSRRNVKARLVLAIQPAPGMSREKFTAALREGAQGVLSRAEPAPA